MCFILLPDIVYSYWFHTDPPVVLVESIPSDIKEGISILLQCVVDANPRGVFYQWSKNGEPIPGVVIISFHSCPVNSCCSIVNKLHKHHLGIKWINQHLLQDQILFLYTKAWNVIIWRSSIEPPIHYCLINGFVVEYSTMPKAYMS